MRVTAVVVAAAAAVVLSSCAAVVVHEFDPNPPNVDPPTRLDVQLDERTLYGMNPEYRCGIYGGNFLPVNYCQGVDY